MEKSGYYYLSLNAGALRLLCPAVGHRAISEMKTAQYVIGTWGECVDPSVMEGLQLGKEMVELLFEDQSETPFLLFISRDEQTDRIPLPTDVRELVFTAWVGGAVGPEKVISKPCYCRNADVPCMRPLGSDN